MSVYNGFVTLDQQVKYYELIKYLLLTMEKRLIKFYKQEPCNEHKFAKIVNKLTHKINKIQNNKYQEPKFADIGKELLSHLPFNPQNHPELNASNFSHYNKNNSDSGTSFNFSVASKAPVLPRRDRWQFNKAQNHQTVPEKKYRSFDQLNNQKIIQEYQQHDRESLQLFPKSKFLKPKPSKHFLKIPKMEQFIKKLSNETKMLAIKQERLKRVIDNENYIGMRRKKGKKVMRSNNYHD